MCGTPDAYFSSMYSQHKSHATKQPQLVPLMPRCLPPLPCAYKPLFIVPVCSLFIHSQRCCRLMTAVDGSRVCWIRCCHVRLLPLLLMQQDKLHGLRVAGAKINTPKAAATKQCDACRRHCCWFSPVTIVVVVLVAFLYIRVCTWVCVCVLSVA